MKKLLTLLVLLPSLFLMSCDNDDNLEKTEDLIHDPVFFNFSLNTKTYELSTNDYRLHVGAFNAGCISGSAFVGGFAYGMRTTKMTALDNDNNFVTSINLGITQKVGIVDLNLADEFSYLRKVLSREGDWEFPSTNEGFAPIRNGIDYPLSEVYLEIQTADGNTYNSTLEEPIIRIEDAFFSETRVLNLGDSAPDDYSYIIEANFKVDLFTNGDAAAPVLVEGNLRLPIYTFTTLEAKMMCD